MKPPPPELPQRKSSINKTPPAVCGRSARVWKSCFWWFSSICCGRFVLTQQDACPDWPPPKRLREVVAQILSARAGVRVAPPVAGSWREGQSQWVSVPSRDQIFLLQFVERSLAALCPRRNSRCQRRLALGCQQNICPWSSASRCTFIHLCKPDP
jgi:hypothetical protein